MINRKHYVQIAELDYKEYVTINIFCCKSIIPYQKFWGLLFFILYINDINKELKQTLLFADDTNLFFQY